MRSLQRMRFAEGSLKIVTEDKPIPSLPALLELRVVRVLHDLLDCVLKRRPHSHLLCSNPKTA